MGLYQGDKPLILTGKSAFQQAVDAGYTGTQAEFAKLLAILPTESKQIKWDNKEESGAAAQALTDAKSYTDTQIKAIPTPDVSGQISTHNKDTAAHQDIRTELGKKEASGTAATAVSTHNKDTSAHTDIREALNGKEASGTAAAAVAAHNKDATAHADIREALSKAGKPFIIEGTLAEDGETISVDKTRAEVKAAVQAGESVTLRFDSNGATTNLSLIRFYVSPDSGGTDFYYFGVVYGDYILAALYYSDDQSQATINATSIPSLSDDAPPAPGTASAGTSSKAARADHVHPKEVSDTDRANWNGKASKPKACLVTLKSSGWDATAKTQGATVACVVADEAAQMIHPMPKIGQITDYNDAGIQLIAQGAGSVTFMCDTIPEADVDVWVVTEDVEDVTPPPPTASVALSQV